MMDVVHAAELQAASPKSSKWKWKLNRRNVLETEIEPARSEF